MRYCPSGITRLGPNREVIFARRLSLKSGKTYNFVAASLRPADSQAVVDALRRTLQ
jgi:hypothetical protein